MEKIPTKLSINVNKIATLRNARGGNSPNVVQFALDCERFGADGITVHPRPDERHISMQDVFDLADVVTTEFNIEGYPDERFLKIIKDVKPTQATLVPDGPDVLTSCAGWDCKANNNFLRDVVSQIQDWGTRVSIFVDADATMMEWVQKTGTDRIELYTEDYAKSHTIGEKEKGIAQYVKAALAALGHDLVINAGHDLSLDNIAYFKEQIPQLAEVSIGHAIVSESLYLGIEEVIRRYQALLDS